MQDHNGERWMQLCTQASQERDPKKLMALVQEILEIANANDARRREHRLRPHCDAQSGSGG
jgi:hypothetical protein